MRMRLYICNIIIALLYIENEQVLAFLPPVVHCSRICIEKERTKRWRSFLFLQRPCKALAFFTLEVRKPKTWWVDHNCNDLSASDLSYRGPSLKTIFPSVNLGLAEMRAVFGLNWKTNETF